METVPFHTGEKKAIVVGVLRLKVRHNSVPTVPVRAYMTIGTELCLLNP